MIEVVCQSDGSVILCQDRARLGSNNVVMEVVYHWGGYVILSQDRARRARQHNRFAERYLFATMG